MERFDATLDRIERRLKEMLKEVENVRLLRQHGPWTALQAYLLRLEDKSERLFLMIFGLDSLHVLKQEMISEDDGELSLNKQLLQILQQGPELGINCILWARSYEGFRSVVDSVYLNRYFNKRIYFGEEEDAATVLGMKFNMRDLEEKTVAYRDMSKSVPNAFRVFELPATDWLESVAQAYTDFRHQA